MAAKKSAPKRSPAAKKVGSRRAPKRSAPKSAAKAASRSARRPARAPKRGSAKPRASATPAPKKRTHPAVVHWEIQSSNPARQRDFFANLFGWSIDANNPQNYGMVPHGGADSIGGGIGDTQDATSRVTVYVEVPDINAALTRAEELGAATILPRTDMGMVVMAQFRDLDGNLIGLVEAGPQAPA